MARVWPRMKRAKPGAKTRAKARETSFTPLPSTATTARARTSGGKARPASAPAHQQVVDPAAAEAGHEPDDQRQHQGEAHGLEGDLHGDAGAVDEAGEDVATEVVGAEPVAGADAGVRVGQVLGVGVVRGDHGAKMAATVTSSQPAQGQHDADADEEASAGAGDRSTERRSDWGSSPGSSVSVRLTTTRTLGLRYP